MGLFSGLFGKESGAEQETPAAGSAIPLTAAPANDTGKPKAKGEVTLAPVMSDDLRNTISRLKGQKPGPDVTSPETLARMFPVSAAIAAEEVAREAARKKAEEEALKNPQPGQLIPGKGVFVGLWPPKDRDGQSLNKTFNLYAAPYDLGLDENGNGKKQLLTYKNTVKAVSKLRGLMGFDGAAYQNDTELYNALRSGSYKGEWFIPTRDIVIGTDVDGNKVQTDTLFAHKDKGKLKDTFTTVDNGSDLAHWYWSCTEHRDDPSNVWVVGFSDGVDVWLSKDNLALSSRLVRAELRP